MKRLFSTLVVGLLVSSCATVRPDRPPAFPTGDADQVWLRIETETGDIVPLALDEYAAGTILAEAALGGLDDSTALRVAQVQAVLARTYALANRHRHEREGFDLCATTHCQVYRPAIPASDRLLRTVEEAVRSTSGVVITHDGVPINAVFHADCGGHTSDARAVWRGSNPTYLFGLPDAYCQRHPAATDWRFAITDAELAATLADHAETSVGGYLDQVVVTERDSAGRVLRLTLDGQRRTVIRGEQLRSAVVAHYGARSLRSTRFTVERQGRRFIFTGRGFGHGVGLCQTGAMVRAGAGHSPWDILTHYYPGTRLETLPRASRRAQ